MRRPCGRPPSSTTAPGAAAPLRAFQRAEPFGSPLRGARIFALALTAMASACTNAQLYDPIEVPSQPDKVAFTGQVCTDNPAERSFPLRVLFVVDSSADAIAGLDGAAAAALDSRRIGAVRDVVTQLRSRDSRFALLRYGGDSLLLPETGFTDNVTELAEAAGALTVAVPCTADGCRRTGQALSIASSLITGDLLSTPRGPRSRTKYVVVFVQNGPADDVVLEGAVTPACNTACVLQERVALLREQVLDGGGADLQVHAIDVSSLSSDEAVRDTTRDELQRMTFSGSGEYRPVCTRDGSGAVVVPGCGPQSLSLVALDINSARNVFLKKSFVVANLNARTRPDGTTIPDSDGDGLADEEEADYGTDPTKRDSDGDGISDKVELLLRTTGLDPRVADDPPGCGFIDEALRTTLDSDSDGLLDCEESLLRLDPTLFDSDGDGLPDVLEVFGGTNFLSDDGLDDDDFDGSTNLDELRAHTNPRAADSKTRSKLAYLYREIDLGIRELLFTSQPRSISGVVVEDVGGLSTRGNGAIGFFRDRGRTLLAWRDANEVEFGNAVLIEAAGAYTLPAACTDVIGTCERFVVVDVTPQLLPPTNREELLRVAAAERQCTDFRVRNVTLASTVAADGFNEGRNDVRIFFGQVPASAPGAFPIFRVAQFPFTFLAPDTKEPNVADQPVEDFRFVLFE